MTSTLQKKQAQIVWIMLEILLHKEGYNCNQYRNVKLSCILACCIVGPSLLMAQLTDNPYIFYQN